MNKTFTSEHHHGEIGISNRLFIYSHYWPMSNQWHNKLMSRTSFIKSTCWFIYNRCDYVFIRCFWNCHFYLYSDKANFLITIKLRCWTSKELTICARWVKLLSQNIHNRSMYLYLNITVMKSTALLQNIKNNLW